MSSSSVKLAVNSLNTAVPRGQVNGAIGATGGTSAADVSYDNSLASPPIPGSPTQVQEAIDGLKPTLDTPTSISYDLSQLQALGAAFSVSILVLNCPANTRLTQPEITITQEFAGPGLSGAALTMQGNADANGTLVNGANGLVVGGYGLGTNPYPSRGGQSIDIEIVLSGGTTFAELTGGGFTARIVTQVSTT
jgi:hypothetical protein